MSEVLKSLLFVIRQHDGFDELLKSVQAPRLPRYVPTKGETLETFGAKSVFASGEQAQHERWLTLLTGQVPARDE